MYLGTRIGELIEIEFRYYGGLMYASPSQQWSSPPSEVETKSEVQKSLIVGHSNNIIMILCSDGVYSYEYFKANRLIIPRLNGI